LRVARNGTAASAIPMSERHSKVGKVPIANVSPFMTISMIEKSAIPATAMA
jgi:hypothetical protein